MARTTLEKVRAILGPDYDGRRDLTTFIRPANIIVTKAATLATNNGESIPAATLTEAEGWVAAGLYIRSDRILTSKNTLSASGSFFIEGQENPYLKSAGELDDNLLAVLSGAVVGGWWLGKLESEQSTYVERNGGV